jgi:hypothetical protein
MELRQKMNDMSLERKKLLIEYNQIKSDRLAELKELHRLKRYLRLTRNAEKTLTLDIDVESYNVR